MELNSYSRYRKRVRTILFEKVQTSFEENLKEYRMRRRRSIMKANEVKLKSKLIAARKRMRVIQFSDRFSSLTATPDRKITESSFDEQSFNRQPYDFLIVERPGKEESNIDNQEKKEETDSFFDQEMNHIENGEIQINHSIEKLNNRLAFIHSRAEGYSTIVPKQTSSNSSRREYTRSLFDSDSSIYSKLNSQGRGVLLIGEGLSTWIN